MASTMTGVSIQSDIATQAAARMLYTLKFHLSRVSIFTFCPGIMISKLINFFVFFRFSARTFASGEKPYL